MLSTSFRISPGPGRTPSPTRIRDPEGPESLIHYEEQFRSRSLLEQQRLASAKMSAAKSTIGARAGKQTKFKTKDERHKMIETTDINRNLRNAFAYFVRIH